jgi:hypothetical protein
MAGACTPVSSSRWRVAEIERKSARHRRALKQQAEAGRIPHGPRLFGYNPEGKVDPTESMIVADSFERFNGGESLRSVTRLLQDHGVPTRSCRPWSTRTVRDMLTNSRHAGWAVYQGGVAVGNDGKPVRENWRPLVSDDVFEVIQARLSDPERKTNRMGTDRRYIGSGLYLCAECSGPIQTVNGGKYYYQHHVIREHSHVDRYVLDAITEQAEPPGPDHTAQPLPRTT